MSEKPAPAPGIPGHTWPQPLWRWFCVRRRRDGPAVAIAVTMIPQSFEARPLRGTSQANGGRCCPHSYFLKFTGNRDRSETEIDSLAVKPFQSFKKLFWFFPGGLPKRARPAGTGGSSVDEAAKPDIHHQANRQENKQCGGAAVAHERQRNAGNRHSADHHSHVY